MLKIPSCLFTIGRLSGASGFASPNTFARLLPLLSAGVCLGVVALFPDSASAQAIRVRSGNNGSGVANGLAEFTTNGGTTWSDLLVQVEYSGRYGNAAGSASTANGGTLEGGYRVGATDTTGILGVGSEGPCSVTASGGQQCNGGGQNPNATANTRPIVAATLQNIGTVAGGTGSSYQGTVAGTDTLEVKQVGGGDAAAQVYNRIFFSFAAPSTNFFVSGLARSDNAGYDAILNYNTPSMQTMNQFAVSGTTPDGSNEIRTIANVASSYSFGDTGSFAGGGTQTFSIVWRNDPQPTSISFDVNFQPVPAPPAAISLGIGGLVGLIGTGVGKLRARRRKQAAKKA